MTYNYLRDGCGHPNHGNSDHDCAPFLPLRDDYFIHAGRGGFLKNLREIHIDGDRLHLYWFDTLEGCWVAFRRVDCVGQEELPGTVIGVLEEPS